jgi:hypothetical protein
MFDKPEPTLDDLKHLVAGMNEEILRLSKKLEKMTKDRDDYRDLYWEASEND